MRLDIDQPSCRGDLAAQRGFLNGRERDVRGEREINGLALERLRLGLRIRGFDRTARAAEYVGHECDTHLRGVQAIGRGAGRCIGVQRRGWHLLAARVERRVDQRKQRTPQRVRVCLRGAHSGFGRAQILIVVDAVRDEPVQRTRTEHFPPARRNVDAAATVLPGTLSRPPGRKPFSAGGTGT